MKGIRKKLKAALCEGRHCMPSVNESIYPREVPDPQDLRWLQERANEKVQGVQHLDLYVTGLSVALVEVIKACVNNNVSLTLWHYDRLSGGFFRQDF